MARNKKLLRGVSEPDCTHSELTKIGSNANACRVKCKICKTTIHDETTDNAEDNPLGIAHNKKPQNQFINWNVRASSTTRSSSSRSQFGPLPKPDTQPPKVEKTNSEKEYREWPKKDQGQQKELKEEPTTTTRRPTLIVWSAFLRDISQEKSSGGQVSGSE